MDELASFTPIVDNLHDRLYEYYQENKPQLPDNTFFSDNFELPQDEPEIPEINPGDYIFDSKDLFSSRISNFILAQFHSRQELSFFILDLA